MKALPKQWLLLPVLFLGLAVLGHRCTAKPQNPEYTDHQSFYAQKPSYQWSYEADASSAREERNGDVTIGQYTVLDPDGTTRIVDYTVAPGTGFQAKVTKLRDGAIQNHLGGKEPNQFQGFNPNQMTIINPNRPFARPSQNPFVPRQQNLFQTPFLEESQSRRPLNPIRQISRNPFHNHFQGQQQTVRPINSLGSNSQKPIKHPFHFQAVRPINQFGPNNQKPTSHPFQGQAEKPIKEFRPSNQNLFLIHLESQIVPIRPLNPLGPNNQRPFQNDFQGNNQNQLGGPFNDPFGSDSHSQNPFAPGSGVTTYTKN